MSQHKKTLLEGDKVTLDLIDRAIKHSIDVSDHLYNRSHIQYLIPAKLIAMPQCHSLMVSSYPKLYNFFLPI